MNAATIDETRLAQVTRLDGGGHRPGKSMCAMEAVAFIAGEPWSDTPECACPVISSFMRAWNDGLPDSERTTLLLPLIPRLVSTRGDAALEQRRALMAADWLVREHTPAWLDLAGLTDQATLLRNLPEITDMAMVPSIRGPIEAVRQDAANAEAAAWAAVRDAAWAAVRDAARAAAWAAVRDAAWAAARDAARDAAWDAVRAAAWDAVRAAAWAAVRAAAWAAAWDAARAAAWAAARDAARDAAWDAVRAAVKAKLEPTRLQLQQSAIKLVERMIDAR